MSRKLLLLLPVLLAVAALGLLLLPSNDPGATGPARPALPLPSAGRGAAPLQPISPAHHPSGGAGGGGALSGAMPTPGAGGGSGGTTEEPAAGGGTPLERLRRASSQTRRLEVLAELLKQGGPVDEALAAHLLDLARAGSNVELLRLIASLLLGADAPGVDHFFGKLRRHEDEGLRLLAVEAFGRRGDEAAASTLFDIAQEDRAANVRLAALRAIPPQRAGAPAAIALLSDLLVRDEDRRVRMASADLLGRLQTPRATQHLVATIAKDALAEDTRAAAAAALGKTGDGQLVPLIADMIERESSPRVKGALQEALGLLQGR